MTQIQFEQLKMQLELLTPQQLKSLQNEIHSNLSTSQTKLVTDEELNLITSLFN
ncbi:hypothetical protein KP803_11415 [Vibrio sp. ZSDE26]|uniref:Uncharacterized protein n=1 Tax=Vibrio amylolyticus TaxID=2847292 RepID=A0A9X1XIJ2_9VIBR|nr:hypothetical protein [Vibrio amylolyticus]MCK6263877.1 hypothetical protein [Vibrio amylolyticus]